MHARASARLMSTLMSECCAALLCGSRRVRLRPMLFMLVVLAVTSASLTLCIATFRLPDSTPRLDAVYNSNRNVHPDILDNVHGGNISHSAVEYIETLDSDKQVGRNAHSALNRRSGTDSAVISKRSTAIVLHVTTINEEDSCRTDRLRSLLELTTTMQWDVWLLYETHQVMSSTVVSLVHRTPHAYLAAVSAPARILAESKVPEQHVRRSSWAFQAWFNTTSNYSHAWYCEEDVVLSGSWTDFFLDATPRAGSADLVAKFFTPEWAWSWSWATVKEKHVNRDGDIIGSQLSFFRISKRLAQLAINYGDSGWLTGHDEALMVHLCDQELSRLLPRKPCTRRELFLPKQSVFGIDKGPGSWHIGVPQWDAAYSLPGVASAEFIAGSWLVNLTKFSTVDDVPRNALFHPVKCEAEVWRHFLAVGSSADSDFRTVTKLMDGKRWQQNSWTLSKTESIPFVDMVDDGAADLFATCASENEVCSCPLNGIMRFGLKGWSWIIKRVERNASVECTLEGFEAEDRDPAYENLKECQCYTLPTDFMRCAWETDVCECPSGKARIGRSDASWIYLDVNSSIECTPRAFGLSADPMPDLFKECQCYLPITTNDVVKEEKAAARFPSKKAFQSMLLGCRKFYFDVGSNVGVQVRKLYEPEKYPGAAILPFFDEFFGSAASRKNSSGLCVLGFEGNSKHAGRLKEVEACYQSRGWRTYFFTPIAVSTETNKTVSFFSERKEHSGSGNNDWGAGTLSGASRGMAKHEVPTVDLADVLDWLQELPEWEPGNTFMKMDIEGSEWSVLPHLLKRGHLCSSSVHTMAAELHMQFAEKGVHSPEAIKAAWTAQKCFETILATIDDESYLLDGQDLPDSCINAPTKTDTILIPDKDKAEEDWFMSELLKAEQDTGKFDEVIGSAGN